MNNIFIEYLPPWVETGLQPAFYDKESGTVLQQTARMYAKVNELTKSFNDLSNETKTIIEEYIDKFDDLYEYVHDYLDNHFIEAITQVFNEALENGGITAELNIDYDTDTEALVMSIVASDGEE